MQAVPSNDPRQTFVVRLAPEKARRMTVLVDDPASAYGTVDEFIAVAIENQLALEGPGLVETASVRLPAISRPAESVNRQPARADLDVVLDRDLLSRPQVQELTTLPKAPSSGSSLSPFTNRLTPLLAGPRVLANMLLLGQEPMMDVLADVTARQARRLGLRLRDEDERAGRRGRYRRSTAWPIGDDESKSYIRFRNCFMYTGDAKSGFAGPLLELGLVAVKENRAALTESGARFAEAESPAIDAAGGVDLLSETHRDILGQALVAVREEAAEIRRFLRGVDEAAGVQDEVDKRLAAFHESWSEAQVVSHRAALVGRLRDLDVIGIDAVQGARPTIVPGPALEKFVTILATTEDQP